jgi:hypothetical protein
MASTPPPGMLAQLLQRIAASGGGPGGAPGGPPGAASSPSPALPGMAAQPSPSGEASAMKTAEQAIGFAMSRFYQRSPEVARELATALVHLKKAMEKSATLPAEPVAAPPPGMPAGGGMIGDLSSPGMPALGA